MTEPGRFSWKRAALHVLLPTVVAALAGGVAAAVVDAGDPRAMGEETGRLLVPGLLLALAASYLGQTRRRAYAWLFGALAALVFAGAVATPHWKRTRSRPLPLDAGDAAAFERVYIGGRAHYRHPALRFSFLQPTPAFAPSAEVTDAMRSWLGGFDSHLVAFADPDAGTVLVVGIEKWTRVEQGTLERIADAMFRQTGPDEDLVERRVVWEPSFRGATVHFADGGTHYRADFHVDAFGAPDAEYLVGLIGVSRDADALAETFASFRYR